MVPWTCCLVQWGQGAALAAIPSICHATCAQDEIVHETHLLQVCCRLVVRCATEASGLHAASEHTPCVYCLSRASIKSVTTMVKMRRWTSLRSAGGWSAGKPRHPGICAARWRGHQAFPRQLAAGGSSGGDRGSRPCSSQTPRQTASRQAMAATQTAWRVTAVAAVDVLHADLPHASTPVRLLHEWQACCSRCG